MKPLSSAAPWLLALVVVTACASTEVTARERYEGAQLARPGRIIVHDFSRRVLVGFGSGAAELRTAVEGYQMTAQGLRPLGRGEIRSGGGEMPGIVLPLAVVAATANPIGLVVGGAVKATGEITGSDTIEGAAKRTADEIAAQLRTAAEAQGWI
jgi:Domain of unknown function (DUF4410)